MRCLALRNSEEGGRAHRALNGLCMVVMRASGRRLVSAVVVWSLTSGCCTSMRRAAALDDELRQENIARAEPAVLSAVERRGATLLPDEPQLLGLIPMCDATRDTASLSRGHCVLYSGRMISAIGELGDVYQILDHGKRRIALTVGLGSRWARLAKRGKSLFLLTPALTFDQVDRRVQCECNGGPVVVGESGHVNLGSAFVLDDVSAEIQQIIVPVVDDYVEWQCKITFVRNDHVPRPAVASADARHAPPSPCFRSWPASWARRSSQ